MPSKPLMSITFDICNTTDLVKRLAASLRDALNSLLELLNLDSIETHPKTVSQMPVGGASKILTHDGG